MTDITENGKYYIPTIEEFHVGLEYQWRDTLMPETVFKDAVVVDGTQIDDIHGMNYGDCRKYELRVKHLDHDDIIELGFNQNDSNYYIKDLGDQKRVTIAMYLDGTVCVTAQNTRFGGYIKNKSELKRIMRQLGIPDSN